MIVTVFRSRLMPGFKDEYVALVDRMQQLAKATPGYISHKGYVAEDGERLSLFEWQSAETLKAWAQHPEHVPTKQLGRQKFYSAYHLQVCEVVRESKFEAKTAGKSP